MCCNQNSFFGIGTLSGCGCGENTLMDALTDAIRSSGCNSCGCNSCGSSRNSGCSSCGSSRNSGCGCG